MQVAIVLGNNHFKNKISVHRAAFSGHIPCSHRSVRDFVIKAPFLSHKNRQLRKPNKQHCSCNFIIIKPSKDCPLARFAVSADPQNTFFAFCGLMSRLMTPLASLYVQRLWRKHKRQRDWHHGLYIRLEVKPGP
jgi:hypothetical protein